MEEAGPVFRGRSRPHGGGGGCRSTENNVSHRPFKSGLPSSRVTSRPTSAFQGAERLFEGETVVLFLKEGLLLVRRGSSSWCATDKQSKNEIMIKKKTSCSLVGCMGAGLKMLPQVVGNCRQDQTGLYPWQ